MAATISPSRQTKIDNWLARAAARAPQRLALVAGEERLTYADLERRARVQARRLAGFGVAAGDRVALALGSTVDQIVLIHALMKLGVVAAPLDPRDDWAHRARTIGAKLVISSAGELATQRRADAPLSGSLALDAAHCIVHTSGSGGEPKAVELTYGNHFWSALGSAARIGSRPDDHWLCCLPLHHVGGLAIVLRSVIYGSVVILEPFEPARVANVIAAERVTVVSLVATMLARLLDAGADLTCLRCALLGGGPAPRELASRALDAGVPLAPTYGLTEAASQVTTLAPDETRRRPGSAGRPLPGCEVKLDEQGRVLVRGPNVAPRERSANGWLRTGDLGQLDEDDHLYVLGRADAVIVTGGENVSPEEIERVLVEHPDIVDAAVTGREDPEWQRAVAAAVVVREGRAPTAEGLRDFCRARLPGFKVPKSFEFVEALPRNEQGKLLRGKPHQGKSLL